MSYYIYIVLLAALLAVSFNTCNSTECTTPDKNLGECKLLSKCETIPFLRDVNRTKQQRIFMIKSICGFQQLKSMICCPYASTTTSVAQATTDPPTTLVPSTLTGSRGMAGDCPASSLPPDPDSKCCGIQGLSFKISGGSETGVDQYPWLVLLEYRDIDLGIIDTKCGGSLISARYVLTAAQCVDAGRTYIPESVRLSEYDTRTHIDCVEEDETEICNNGSVSIRIEEIIIHHQFKRGRHPKNNIALLRLTELVTINDFIRPICLPSVNKDTPRNLFVAGWGATSTGSRSSIKMHAMLPFINLTACNSYYHHQLEQRQICAGGEIGKDACKGDSGGPLMRYLGTHYEILGIVSYGSKPCGYYPGVYTNVMEYLDWIKMKMHE